MGTMRLINFNKNIIHKGNVGPIFLYRLKNSKQNMSKLHQLMSKDSSTPR